MKTNNLRIINLLFDRYVTNFMYTTILKDTTKKSFDY